MPRPRTPFRARGWPSRRSEAQAADDLRGHQLTFAGDRFTIRSKGQVIYRGTYIIDASAKPAAIDFRDTAGERKGKTWLRIYELDGDTLRICDNARTTDSFRERRGLGPGPDSSYCLNVPRTVFEQ